MLNESRAGLTSFTNQMCRFWLKVYPPSFLSAGCVAEWRGVLGKSGCCEEERKPIIIRDVEKAIYSLPQGMLSKFCTNATLIELFNIACPVKLSLILFNRGQQRPLGSFLRSE